MQSSEFFTVERAAAKCQKSPATIHVWLYRMRQAGRGPKPGQIRKVRLNAARRYLEIRDDYLALMQAIFMERSIRL